MALGQYVKWHKSLRFRFFIWVGIFLLAAMGVITWHNGSLFNTILTQQAQERVGTQTKAVSTNVNAIVDLWVTIIHSTMHNVRKFDDSSIGSLASGLLASNKEIVALEVFSKVSNAPIKSISFRFTDFASHPDFASKNPKLIAPIVRDNTLKAISALSKSETFTQKKRVAQKLFITELNIPLIQIYTPFIMQNSNETIWAVLTLWPDKFREILENSAKTTSYLLNSNGQIIIGGGINQGITKVKSQQLLEDMLNGKWNSGIKAFNDNNTPYFISFNKIPNYSLFVMVERSAKDEYQYITWRLRQTTILAAIILLISVMAMYILTGKLAGGIIKLASTAVEIGAGNLQARNTVITKDEVGLLGSAMNYMAKRLEELLLAQVEATRQAAELKTAQAVENTLFPRNQVCDGWLVVSGHYEPATECAGDWWGYFPITKDLEVVVIADATGHGASAALVVAMIFAYFQTLISQPDSELIFSENIENIAKALNKVLCGAADGMCTLTMFLATFNFKTRKLTYINAGHVFPYLIRSVNKNGSEEETSIIDSSAIQTPGKAQKLNQVKSLAASGTPVGMLPVMDISAQSTDLHPGDRVVFLTDGYHEIPNDKGDGISKQRFKKYLESKSNSEAESLKDDVVNYFLSHVGKSTRIDDVTVVVAKVLDTWV